MKRPRPIAPRTGRLWPDRLHPATRNRASNVVNSLWDWFCALGMVGPEDERGRRFRHMGPGSGMAFPRGPIFGEQWISIGERTLFSPHCTLSAGLFGEPLDPGLGPIVVVGARCSIGRGTALVGRTSLVIEDDVTIAPNVYVTDHNHTYDDPDVPVGLQWPSEAPVRIGAGSWIGTGAVVLPGTDLGRNSTVAAGSVVRGRFPDHSVVAGSPAKVVRSYHDGRWDPPLPDRNVRAPEGFDPRAG